MKTLGIVGWKNSGKTSLIVELIKELGQRGLRTSTMKQAPVDFDIDQPGKDFFRHSEAGAVEVLLDSGKRWALLHEVGDNQQPTMKSLVELMAPVDLVLVEGFKLEYHDKIEVHRPEQQKPLMYPDDNSIIALVRPTAHDQAPVPVFALDDVVGIADFISERFKLT